MLINTLYFLLLLLFSTVLLDQMQVEIGIYLSLLYRKLKPLAGKAFKLVLNAVYYF